MTPRTAAPLRATAIVVLLCALLTVTAQSAMAETITLQARALLGGRFEAGGWAAISVGLANDGEPVTGYLAADGEDGTVRRLVELPAGSRKEVVLYVRPPVFGRGLEVRFENADGERLAVASADLRVLERTTGHVAVLGDGGGNLRPQLIARGPGLPEPVTLAVADIPERPEPMRGIETLVWAGDASGLTEAQGRTIERWIAAGGQLVVLGGPDWQARAAAFADLLPVTDLAAVDEAAVSPLADWSGSEPLPGIESLTLAVGELRPGAVELIGTPDGVLFAAMTRGAGRVSFLGADLATEPFRGWAGSPSLWQRLVPDDRVVQQFGGFGPPEEEVAGMISGALSNIPSLEVPPAELLLAVILGYIVLIGPVSYVVLRRFDRRELAWVTAPALVLIFSAGSYGIGTSMKGSQIIVNEIAMVRTTTDGTAASVSTYAGIFSPTRATYDIRVAADALISPLQTSSFDGSQQQVQVLTEQGEPSRLRGLGVSVFGIQAVRAEAVLPYAPALQVSWSLRTDGIVGTVTNRGDATLEDVAVISQGGGAMVGTLEPGASEEFRMALRNLNGSAASEQVYGFLNFDPSSAAQRQAYMRRQVIDALVGYGGGWAGRVGELSGGLDRGPFVIGWLPDAAPMPVEVDDHSVQRYSQMVEIVSGRPQLGPGEVALQASQLPVELVETTGDASQQEPGFVTLATGSAVFQASLPLEATGLVPTKVTLLAGNDPGTIIFDQPNFGAVLPDGFRIAVYDAVADDWQDVGDLSVASRFEIEDPARVIDDGGRILIRITGAVDPTQIGEVPVWAGAMVEGVI